ncbi:mitochondrial fission ELM1 family protein [Phenylobacterium sp.]|uniref:mitochondrial fission ELM1 family protein n=1 Tax=Phenylobacterium sp. TaxID=1871053 RepID=UPI0039839754
MAKAPQPELTIWAVSDGRAGIEAQAEGLAMAVARLRPATVILKRIGWKAGLGRLPWWLNPFPRLALRAESSIAAPWPDVWIAAGRASLPLSTRVRRWSGGQTFVVQTQNPRAPAAAFDLIVPPEHDGLAGPNVFPVLGAPNRLTADRLAAELARFAPRLADLPHPRVAVIVGGTSKAFDLPADHAAAMAAQVAAAVEAAGGSVMVSFTRRTPAAARAAIAGGLRPLPGWIWDERGDNPYIAFLAAADAILVTEDSVNLTTDAAATGAPIYRLTLTGGSAKFARFHAELEARGIARRFAGRLETWRYPPLFEADRAAADLLRRYDARKNII